jgi:putative transcriptional regulator
LPEIASDQEEHGSPSLYLALRIAAYFEVPVEVIFSTEPFPRIGSVGISAS